MGFRFRKRLRITEASIIATSPVFNRTFAISPWMVIAIDGSPRLRHRLCAGRKNHHGPWHLSIPVRRLDSGFNPSDRLMRHDANGYRWRIVTAGVR